MAKLWKISKIIAYVVILSNNTLNFPFAFTNRRVGFLNQCGNVCIGNIK